MDKYLAGAFISLCVSVLVGFIPTFSDGCALAHVPHIGEILLSVFAGGATAGFVIATIIRGYEKGATT